MTDPRDDLMALADRLRELVFRQGQIDWDALIKIEIDLRLAASLPATQVVDREAVALSELVFKAIKFVDIAAGEGIVFDDLDPALILCDYADVIGTDCWEGIAEAIRDAILSLLRPAEPVEIEHPALEWSLSDDAKRRLSEIDENIRHAVIASPGMKAGGIQPGPDAVGEPVAWRVLITKNAKTYNEYTERLPFEPLEGSGVVVRREPEPLYTHPPKSPDTSAAVLQSHALKQALDCLSEIAAAHIPDCPAHYAGEELAWAQRHVAHLRSKAGTARDGIAATIRSLSTNREGEK